MALRVGVETVIGRPVVEVHRAIVDPARMSGYFITRGSGWLEAGRSVLWTWEDYGAELSIRVERADLEHIAFFWTATGAETRVDLRLEALSDGRTRVLAREESWPLDEGGAASYGQQVQGWTNMLDCLKAYLEHGINLRR